MQSLGTAVQTSSFGSSGKTIQNLAIPSLQLDQNSPAADYMTQM